jgi:hypothetical protein
VCIRGKETEREREKRMLGVIVRETTFGGWGSKEKSSVIEGSQAVPASKGKIYDQN